MKKTVSINLSKMSFTIDEEAYFKLRQYLDTIRGYFSDSEGREEIMADIEARIAEMLQEKITETYQVISLEDIDEVIGVMGQPEEYIDDDASEDSQGRSGYAFNSTRRIYRDPDGKVLGGVCSGLGYYFGFDPIWARLAFLIAFFVFGTGILLYILLWVIFPKAVTTAEKLEMKGEPVNVSNIGRAIEDEFENLKTRFNTKGKKNGGSARSRSGRSSSSDQVIESVGHALNTVLKGLGKIAGIFMIVIASIILIGFTLSMVGLNESTVIIGDEPYGSYTVGDITNAIFYSNTESIIARIALSLFIIIPLALIVLTGIRLIASRRIHIKGLGIVLGSIWAISLISLIFVGTRLAADFSQKEYFTEEFSLDTQVTDTTSLDTLVLDVGPDVFAYSRRHRYHREDDFAFKIKDGQLYLGYMELEVETTTENDYKVIVEKKSRGMDAEAAYNRAERISYYLTQNENRLVMDPYYNISPDDRYRFQDVTVIVQVPEGKSVTLSNNIHRVLEYLEDHDRQYREEWEYDYGPRHRHRIRHYRSPGFANYSGKTFTVKDGQLTCSDCEDVLDN